ncbi:MAG TPA: carboxypeptidase-like regulatory domain-containing protein [Terriglobia bacterium]|nr:carboxypeptidase-like regulatory domain-containing protein [Terriglobia bacterium]
MRRRPIVLSPLLPLLMAMAPAMQAQANGSAALGLPEAPRAVSIDFDFVVAAQVAGIIQGSRSSQQNSASTGTSSIEGTVADAQTGQPVRKAEVTAFATGQDAPDPQSIATDASGHFTIGGLPAGKYRLRVWANRFAPQAYGASRSGDRGKTVDVAAGQHVSGIDFRLVPCGVVTGEIHDESGDPVEGAMVQAVPVGRRRGFRGGSQGQTNDLGQYRLYNLPPGKYMIAAMMPRAEVRQPGTEEEAYVPTFYPGTTDPVSAAAIAVDPGTEAEGIDIDVHPVRAVRVSGSVMNLSGGGSTQNAYVMLMPAGLDPRRRRPFGMMTAGRYSASAAGPRGEFEITGVPAGSYWAVANLQDSQRQYEGRVQVQVADADVQGVTIPVSAGANLTGHVRVDSQGRFDYSKLTVAAMPTDGVGFGGQGAQVRPDGSFTLENVPAGNYRLNVSGYPEGYYLKAVRFGGGDVLDTGLSVDATSGAAQLDILLSAGGSSVSGTVMNDGKPAQATVLLVPDPPHRDREDLYSVKSTKSDGSFSMPGLPPGDFKLFAFEDLDPGLMGDPSLLQPYESKGSAVHLDQGQKQTVQLELIPAQE